MLKRQFKIHGGVIFYLFNHPPSSYSVCCYSYLAQVLVLDTMGEVRDVGRYMFELWTVPG